MYYTVKQNSYTPTIEDPNPEGLLRSSLDSKSSNLAGVMSSLHYFGHGYLEEEKSMIHIFTVTFGDNI
jgi:hypothetical protein